MERGEFIEKIRSALELENLPLVEGRNVPGYVTLLSETFFLNVVPSDERAREELKSKLGALMRILQNGSETQELIEALDAAMSSLSLQEQEVLRLRYSLGNPEKELGLSYAEIGTALVPPVGNTRVGQIITHAQRRLRQLSRQTPISGFSDVAAEE